MKDDKIVFGIMEADDGPVLMLGVPEPAYDAIRDGRTQNFDLSRVGLGLNLKVILFGAKTHQEAIRMIEDGAKKKGVVIDDRRRDDFTIKND